MGIITARARAGFQPNHIPVAEPAVRRQAPVQERQ